jgi:uncharacterized repeat protein (TIGR03803 family)
MAAAATGFKTIYSFSDSPDGADPRAGVTVSPKDSNYLFGTTLQGGSGPGTVWSVNLSDDTETVVYEFPGKPEGFGPFAGLAVLDHFFYGTTASGGTRGDGTVYKIPDSGSGTATVIHSFERIRGDGARPRAALTVIGRELYGTTTEGRPIKEQFSKWTLTAPGPAPNVDSTPLPATRTAQDPSRS